MRPASEKDEKEKTMENNVNLKVEWSEVNLEALRAAFRANDYYVEEYSEYLGENDVMNGGDPVGPKEFAMRFLAGGLLRQWCKAAKAVRDEVPALTDPAKLQHLRDVIAACRSLDDVVDTFGVDNQLEDGIYTSEPEDIVGKADKDHAIDVTFLQGARAYDVSFCLQKFAERMIVACSKEEAREKAAAMLDAGQIGWEPERPDISAEERWLEERER